MARTLVGVHTLGVLTYQTTKSVLDEKSPTGARAETVTCTATMPDASSVPAPAKKSLAGAVRVSLAAGVIGFYTGSDDQPSPPLPEAKPAKAAK